MHMNQQEFDAVQLIDVNPAIPVIGHQGLFDWEVSELVANKIMAWDSAHATI